MALILVTLFSPMMRNGRRERSFQFPTISQSLLCFSSDQLYLYFCENSVVLIENMLKIGYLLSFGQVLDGNFKLENIHSNLQSDSYIVYFSKLEKRKNSEWFGKNEQFLWFQLEKCQRYFLLKREPTLSWKSVKNWNSIKKLTVSNR